MAKIPEFKTLEEEREFWQIHDTTEFLDGAHMLTDQEAEAMNAKAQARRVAKMLTAVRSKLGNGVADSIEQEIRDLMSRRCRDCGVNLDELLSRNRAA